MEVRPRGAWPCGDECPKPRDRPVPMATALVLAAAVHAAGWTPPTAVRGNTAAQRNTLLLVDQAAPFRVTMRPDAAGALGVEVDANDRGAAVITSIVRGSHVSELLEVGDALQPGCTRAPSAQATAVHRLRLRWQRACQPAMAQGCTTLAHTYDTPAFSRPHSATYHHHSRWWSRSTGATRRRWARWSTLSPRRPAS